VFVRPENLEGITHFASKLTGITKDMVEDAESLLTVVQKFDSYIMEKFGGNKNSFRLVTDGIWDLQIQLGNEAKKKNIELNWWYKEYFDIKQEFIKFYPWFNSYKPVLKTMLQAFKLEFIGKHHSGIDDCRSIVQLVKTMLLLGLSFDNPIIIPEDYSYKDDPNFIDFGSTTVPESWQCEKCEIWNRPWTKSCLSCDYVPEIKHTEMQNILDELENEKVLDI